MFIFSIHTRRHRNVTRTRIMSFVHCDRKRGTVTMKGHSWHSWHDWHSQSELAVYQHVSIGFNCVNCVNCLCHFFGVLQWMSVIPSASCFRLLQIPPKKAESSGSAAEQAGINQRLLFHWMYCSALLRRRCTSWDWAAESCSLWMFAPGRFGRGPTALISCLLPGRLFNEHKWTTTILLQPFATFTPRSPSHITQLSCCVSGWSIRCSICGINIGPRVAGTWEQKAIVSSGLEVDSSFSIFSQGYLWTHSRHSSSSCSHWLSVVFQDAALEAKLHMTVVSSG